MNRIKNNKINKSHVCPMLFGGLPGENNKICYLVLAGKFEMSPVGKMCTTCKGLKV